MSETELHYVTGITVIPEGLINYFLAWFDLALVREYKSIEDAVRVRNGDAKLVKRSQLLRGKHGRNC